MFAELNKKFKRRIFSLITIVLLINFMVIFFSYSYIMKSDYKQKVIHICEKSTEYILLKLNSVEDTAVAFSRDNSLKSALFTYRPYVINTIAGLKTVNEDIASAFVVGGNQSYFYNPEEKGAFESLLPKTTDEMQKMPPEQWVVLDEALFYICKIYEGEQTIGVLGFRLKDDLFQPIFRDYSDYFLHDVNAFIFNGESGYTIFGDAKPVNSDVKAGGMLSGGKIVYRLPYDESLSVMITTSQKHIIDILARLFIILLIILAAACALLYLVLNKYLGFVTDKLKQLRLKIQKFSNEFE